MDLPNTIAQWTSGLRGLFRLFLSFLLVVLSLISVVWRLDDDDADDDALGAKKVFDCRDVCEKDHLQGQFRRRSTRQDLQDSRQSHRNGLARIFVLSLSQEL